MAPDCQCRFSAVSYRDVSVAVVELEGFANFIFSRINNWNKICNMKICSQDMSVYYD